MLTVSVFLTMKLVLATPVVALGDVSSITAVYVPVTSVFAGEPLTVVHAGDVEGYWTAPIPAPLEFVNRLTVFVATPTLPGFVTVTRKA
jgi:hypothetical protein